MEEEGGQGVFLAGGRKGELVLLCRLPALQRLQNVNDRTDHFFIRWLAGKSLRQYRSELPRVVPLRRHFYAVYVD
jgi:hypothetical protein